MTAMYDIAVPLVQRGLQSLEGYLDKAEAFAKEKNMDIKELLDARLCEDMLPFTFQVQIATDVAAKMIRRVMGQEPDNFDRAEVATVEGMRKRIAHVQDIIKTADAKAFSSNADKLVPLGLGPGKNFEVSALGWVMGYGLPNYFFHLNTAYSILRMKGVPLGKADYQASFLKPYLNKEA